MVTVHGMRSVWLDKLFHYLFIVPIQLAKIFQGRLCSLTLLAEFSIDVISKSINTVWLCTIGALQHMSGLSLSIKSARGKRAAASYLPVLHVNLLA